MPALDPDSGIDYIGRPDGWGLQEVRRIHGQRLPQAHDKIKPDWDLRGAAEDLRVFFRVGDLVANGSTYPQWKPGTEFKARRDSMMAGAKQ